jgi:hypothetical protein
MSGGGSHLGGSGGGEGALLLEVKGLGLIDRDLLLLLLFLQGHWVILRSRSRGVGRESIMLMRSVDRLLSSSRRGMPLVRLKHRRRFEDRRRNYRPRSLCLGCLTSSRRLGGYASSHRYPSRSRSSPRPCRKLLLLGLLRFFVLVAFVRPFFELVVALLLMGSRRRLPRASEGVGRG